MMTFIHLTSSRFLGGPERYMLGLTKNLPERFRAVFFSFNEGGLAERFIEHAHDLGHEAHILDNDTPHFLAAINEIRGQIRRLKARAIICHGYKADILGRHAAWREGIPALGVAHGWTKESLRVRVYEGAERLYLRMLDRVICVSEAQAKKVQRLGIPRTRIRVIPNAIDVSRFPDVEKVGDGRRLVDGLFGTPKRYVIGSAGRLSPEKGYEKFVEAAAMIRTTEPDVGFVIFGEGKERGRLTSLIHERGLEDAFLLPGLRTDLDRLLSALDVFVLSSYTEGLPTVVLESLAAGVPVVATRVGGTPEVVDDSVNGFLVPAGDAPALAQRVIDLIRSDTQRQAMARAGRRRVIEEFSFEKSAEKFQLLIEELTGADCRPAAPRPAATPGTVATH